MLRAIQNYQKLKKGRKMKYEIEDKLYEFRKLVLGIVMLKTFKTIDSMKSELSCIKDSAITKDKATEDMFNGVNSKSARKACPQTIWRVASTKTRLYLILNRV